MNIFYIDHYAGSLSMGMEFRPFYLAREWKKLGHNVRIIVADFSHLRKVNPNIKNDFDITEEDGIEFQWIKTRKYQGNGVQRALTMFEFCFALWNNAKRLVEEFAPDVVIASSTYPLDTYPAQKIAKLANAKYIHEGHDLWPLTLTEIGGMSKHHPFVLLMQMAENSAYKNADHVVSVLPNAIEHMLKHGLQSKDKFTCIQNGIALEDWKNSEDVPDEHKELFKRLHDEGKFIVCYLGGHALSNALELLIDAARITHEDDGIAYVLIGSGSEKNRLIEISKSIRNIYFLPPVSKKQVPSVLGLADCLYIGSLTSPLYKYGVSMNKVYDYMMAGKPIVYAVNAYNNDVELFKCGITVNPQKTYEILKAIKLCKHQSKERLDVIGENGKKGVIENYEYSVLAGNFAKLF